MRSSDSPEQVRKVSVDGSSNESFVRHLSSISESIVVDSKVDLLQHVVLQSLQHEQEQVQVDVLVVVSCGVIQELVV